MKKQKKIKVRVDATTYFTVDQELVQWTKTFIEKYRKALESLAKQ